MSMPSFEKNYLDILDVVYIKICSMTLVENLCYSGPVGLEKVSDII
ncbi:hypothetical protein DSUL_80084 [Desulfovibrionales bacterium]